MYQTSALERFWAKVDKGDGTGCWLWTAHLGWGRNPYGIFKLDGRNRFAHRLAYELLVGPVPDGLVIDHLCKVKRCVNPAHMEPVTNRVNILRGEKTIASRNAAKSHCKNGHPFDEDNTYTRPGGGGRGCRKCINAAVARYAKRRSSH